MSVLIKGMEMPSGCNMCQLRDLCYDYYICRAKKLNDGRYLDVDDVTNRRHLYCPLIEVPTPHGRLIDADQLQTAIHGCLCKNCVTFPCEKGIGCLIEDAFNLIDEAPTVIEEEHESEARKYVEIGKAISKGLQEGIEAINSEEIEE